MAEQASKEIRGAKHTYWFKHLRVENDNLRAALAWSFRGNEPSFGLRLTSALTYHWSYNGHSTEGLRWCELALEKAAIASPELKAGILLSAGRLAYYLGDIQRGKQLLNEAWELYQQLGLLHLLLFLRLEDNCKLTRYISLLKMEVLNLFAEAIALIHLTF